MKKKVGVIGVGSAGLLSVMHLCVWLDKSWEVYSIHDPAKKILGIGESTNGEFIHLLEQATNFSIANEADLKSLDATLKMGSRFIDWREHSWINPLLNGNIAVHFNNRKFKNFAFERLRKRWPEQFRVLEGDVRHLQDLGTEVALDIEGKQYAFDYVIDCRGTPDDFSDYELSDCTELDRCLVHQVDSYEFRPFTDHVATQHGWMFGVPLSTHKTYGYLYCHRITSKQDAISDFQKRLGADELWAGNYEREYVLRSYYTKQLVSGRICKNGNRALFFEPLIANSIFLYLKANRLIYDYMENGAQADTVNRSFCQSVQEMEDVISYYYQGGSMYESLFWKEATRSAQNRLRAREPFLQYLGELRRLNAQGVLHRGRGYTWAPHTWQVVDEQLGYNYFTEN